MFICWGFYWCNKFWIPKHCKCTPSYIRYMVHINHPPLSGSCGIASFPKFNGGEIGGLLRPSLLLNLIPIDFCCVMVDIYALSGTNIATSTWVVSINGHTPLNIGHVIKFHMGISRVVIRFVFIGIIGVPIGKLFGFDPYQYEDTMIGGCCSNPYVVLKHILAPRLIVNKLVEFPNRQCLKIL